MFIGNTWRILFGNRCGNSGYGIPISRIDWTDDARRGISIFLHDGNVSTRFIGGHDGNNCVWISRELPPDS